MWFLGSLGALLGGLEFIAAATLGLLALDPTDFMLLKYVVRGSSDACRPVLGRGFSDLLALSVAILGISCF